MPSKQAAVKSKSSSKTAKSEEKKPVSVKSASAVRKSSPAVKESHPKAEDKTSKQTKATGLPQGRIRIKIFSYDYKLIDYCVSQIVDSITQSGGIIAGPIPLPTDKKIFTLNSSTFVDKNSREQFEIRTHKRLIDIVESTPKTMEMLNQLDLPAGVDVEIKIV